MQMLALMLTSLATILALTVYLHRSMRTTQGDKRFMLSQWGRQQVHQQRQLRALGQEPSVIDLRYISQKEWQPFTNVIPLGG